ncbi:glutamyl-tRNA synthetase [Actinobacteria bacterium IMCC26256]|nr:glutamyl-tRNA synthetase [Actinobacteria bacterium IMCC26256]
MPESNVRVRFSPAPTGFLHVGGARTALFNWLFARSAGGVLILRIEDTDVARSRQEWVDGIQETLTWLGLGWDEGPVLQSDRFELYLAAADQMLAEGLAYECFCTEEESKERNDAAVAAGRPPGYDGHCRNLSEAERVALRDAGRPLSLRFRTPDIGSSEFVDVVRGPVSVEWSTISDFVIVRSDGTPIFFLANAVDDLEMGITHVVRGEDLLDSTHRVLALRRAMGSLDAPTYAHLPLIVGEDRAKLSKRHGAVSLEDFRDRGYLPEALLNYLALLGWAPDEGKEVMDAEEIAREFDLDRVTHSAAYFDHQKLEWVNGEWIRRLSLETLVERVLPYAETLYGSELDKELLLGAVRIGQERATTLVQLAEQMDFLFLPAADFVINPDSWERVSSAEGLVEILGAVLSHLEKCEWSVEDIDLRPALEALGVKPRKGLPAVYAAIEGRHAGLPLFDSIHLLGRDESLRRVSAALSLLGG